MHNMIAWCACKNKSQLHKIIKLQKPILYFYDQKIQAYRLADQVRISGGHKGSDPLCQPICLCGWNIFMQHQTKAFFCRADNNIPSTQKGR